MSIDKSLLTTLKTTYEQNPEDFVLGLHVAEMLIKDKQFNEALKIYQTIIKQKPDEIKALEGAILCADSVNAYDQTILDKPERPLKPAKLKVVGGTEKPENKLDDLDSEAPEITLADVGGMEQVKKRIELSFLAPIKNPELMKAYGKTIGGGLLLYGPPGCGKTYIARALAGELGARFYNIGLTDVLDMYIGESERQLHELFENARRQTPAVMFFDELDALGQKRSQLKHSGMRSVVNQLLAEMDSLGSDNTDLFIIGATNHPWDIDSALRRPGRFDRMVTVFPPDLMARKAIFEMYLKGKPVDNIDTDYLAKKTEKLSGADIKFIIESALEYAMEKAMQSGEIAPLNNASFKKPLKEARPSTIGWFETAKNYAMFANEGGIYDDLLSYIRQHKL